MVRDMEPLEHQIRTAKTVLRRFRGRALLCDEVGLGKTIEAGLILAELALRGLVRSVLVLVPPSLIEQWQGEMRRKFALELTSHDDPAFRERGAGAWGEFDRVIASIHTAKREPHRSAILAREWDMVIIDEAHHLRNRNTQAWKLAGELRKQFILLLTATPVQNNLEELFNLVTLLEPGLLSTAEAVPAQFVDRRDKLTPQHVDELHAPAGGGDGPQPPEHGGPPVHPPLGPHRAADALARRAGALPRRHRVRPAAGCGPAKEAGPITRMALLTLQMALGSSSPAAAGTLRTIAETSQAGGGRPQDARRPGRPRRRAAREHQGRPPAGARRRVPRQDGRLHPVPGHPGDAPAPPGGGGARRGGLPRRPVAAGEGGGHRAVPRARPGSCSAPRPAARGGTSSSPTPSATSTSPGTR